MLENDPPTDPQMSAAEGGHSHNARRSHDDETERAALASSTKRATSLSTTSAQTVSLTDQMAAEESRVAPPVDDEAAAHPMLGTTLRGTYHITEVLDQGGMGMVFIAEHLRLRKRLAVKVLAKHLADDTHALARFHREAEIISQLNHPCIVQVVDFDTTQDGEPYLVMELLKGESLESRLEREHHLSVSEALRIAVLAASGLTAAHDKEIVHRDLKPGNIFLQDVSGEGTFVKLLDFGISKRAGVGKGLTGEFDILGTPDFMAPEQASGKTAMVDHRGDQFALAVITYQMLTGALPFAGNNLMEVLQRVLNDTPCAPSVINEELPETIDAVILKALSKSPDDRFDTVNEFARALARAGGSSLTPMLSAPPSARIASTQHIPALALPISETLAGRVPSITPTLEKPGHLVTPPPATGTHTIGRRRLVSSAIAEAVSDLLDQARQALDEGDPERAAARAEEALELADSHNDDALARRSVDSAETLLTRVFEHRLGELSQVVEIKGTGSKGTSLSPEQAFLLSRLEGGVSFEEALDLTPIPRQHALRQLVHLLRAGWIEVQEPYGR